MRLLLVILFVIALYVGAYSPAFGENTCYTAVGHEAVEVPCQ